MLTSVSQLAPASTAARAIIVRSVTFGESFANTGSVVAAATAAIDGAGGVGIVGEDLRTRACRFGQLTFTSIATRSSRAGTSNSAARVEVFDGLPHTDAITRAPVARERGEVVRDPRGRHRGPAGRPR